MSRLTKGGVMTVMRTVGSGRALPGHAHVREDGAEYVVELDVSDFARDELAVEALGPVVTVHGEQAETAEDQGLPFRLRERLEEAFRLPDDAAADRLSARYRHGVLEIHAPRVQLERRAVPVEHGPQYLIHPDAAAC
jgi:HSP20 family molecular chaperone IbpA